MSQKNAWISIGAIVVVLLVGYWGYNAWYARQNANDVAQTNAAITHFTLEKPNFVVTGRNLSKVEIWVSMVPTGGVTESSVFVGAATPSSATINDEQRWLLQIPTQPIAAREIYARGWDMNGNEVPKVSLPFVGAAEIFNEVWGVVTEQQLALKVGERMTFEDLSFTFTRVVNDSRCPVGVTCVTAGNVTVEVDAQTPRMHQTIEVRSGNDPARFDGYFVEVASVEPAKTVNPLGQDQYRVVFIVSRDAKL